MSLEEFGLFSVDWQFVVVADRVEMAPKVVDPSRPIEWKRERAIGYAVYCCHWH